MTERAVFLDKDGTLVENLPFNVDPELIRLAPGAGSSLALLQAAGYRLIVVSNQSGVARGYFEPEALDAVARQLGVLLADCGVRLDGFYYCPHHPQGTVSHYARTCGCRKPRPGLLRQAASDLQVDLSRSWFIGDILDDVEAGRSAGCRTVLLDNGNETEWILTPDRTPDVRVSDLDQAAQAILGREAVASGQ
jgi:D-glycero-D-manno-heptose 1,7-bisphosphate phosphatase